MYEYTYQYALPNSPYCLKVLEIVDSSGALITDYDIEKRYILTDSTTCYIKYIGRISDYNLMPGNVINAYAYYLASEIAINTSEDKNLADMMFKKYNILLRDAKTADAKQHKQQKYTNDIASYRILSARNGSYVQTD